MEKLVDDVVQPLDFVLGCVDHLGGGLTVKTFFGFVGEHPLEKLHVQVKTVQRVADFMRDAGGQHGYRLNLFSFQFFDGAVFGLGDIPENYCRVTVFLLGRHQIKLQIAVNRIEYLNFLSGGTEPFIFILLENAVPVHIPQKLGNPQIVKVVRQSEQLLRRFIVIADLKPAVNYQNTFLDCVEYRFQEAFLA